MTDIVTQASDKLEVTNKGVFIRAYQAKHQEYNKRQIDTDYYYYFSEGRIPCYVKLFCNFTLGENK